MDWSFMSQIWNFLRLIFQNIVVLYSTTILGAAIALWLLKKVVNTIRKVLP